jgi:hypothetical protein
MSYPPFKPDLRPEEIARTIADVLGLWGETLAKNQALPLLLVGCNFSHEWEEMFVCAPVNVPLNLQLEAAKLLVEILEQRMLLSRQDNGEPRS